MMMKSFVLSVVLVGCTSSTGTHDYSITGDTCKVYASPTSCDANPECTWIDLGISCRVGEPCISGECQSRTGSGSGSGSGGGTGSGSAACACTDGGVCFEQIGGPAASTEPTIQCYGPAACPGGCASPCDEIVGQGACTLDPSVANLCICDNGQR